MGAERAKRASTSPSEVTRGRADTRRERRSPTVAFSARTERHRALQAKLTVGPAGDRYEQEADRVAVAVMRHLRRARPDGAPAGTVDDVERPAIRRRTRIQSMTAPPGAAESRRSVSRIQRLVTTPTVGAGGGVTDTDTEAAIRRARAAGQPLHDGIRRSMEQSFGTDFSAVRIHADGAADDLNHRILARAATIGSDIFFSEGQYNPSSASGQELLAHELTHVVQQGAVSQSGPVRRSPAVVQRLFLAEANREIGEDQTTLKAEYQLARTQGRNADLAAIMHLQTSTAVRPEAIMAATFPAEFLAQIDLTEMGTIDAEAPEVEAEEADPVLAELADSKIATALYIGGAGAAVARRFKASFAQGGNPAIPVPLMTDLRKAGWLVFHATKYRDSSYGANGMVYEFRIKGIRQALGEWHVHWEAKGKAGNPGWKRGKTGEKTATGDEMRAILGDRWAVVKGTGGNWV